MVGDSQIRIDFGRLDPDLDPVGQKPKNDPQKRKK
jgi:hypothetical protein